MPDLNDAIASNTTVSPISRLTESHLTLGDVVEIAPDARLIAGIARDMRKNIPNIANAVMYRVDSTLVVIDNGATVAFREYLAKAADQLRPFNKAILIITHGHCDHTGNNDWIDTLGVPATAYMSNSDHSMMWNQAETYAPLIDAVGPFVPGLPSGEVFAQAVLAPFGELNLRTNSLTYFESLDMEEIEIGGTYWNGWRLLGGKVIALQTMGHTKGHVAVYLPAIKHLHFADETTGYYQAIPNGTPQANLLSLKRALSAFKAGAITSLTDGHTFRLYTGEQAISYLEGIVSAAVHFHEVMIRILKEHPNGIMLNELMETVSKEMQGAPGENTMPALRVMRVINKLRELGIPIPPDGHTPVLFQG